MKWILVVYAYSCLSGGGIDPGIISGNCNTRGLRSEIEMPSQAACEEVRDLNKGANAECWAKADAPQSPAQLGDITRFNIAPHNFTLSPNVALPH